MKKILFILLVFLLMSGFTFGQDRKVCGIITDVSGIAIPGVGVGVDGTYRGTNTDIDGKYSIKVNPTEFLVFSFLGMKSQRISASKDEINVKLEEDDVKIVEIVPPTYNIKKRIISVDPVRHLSQKEINLKLNGKKYTGCHGKSCHKVIGGGYMSSDCMIFDFSKKKVTITSYQKRSNSEGKYNLKNNVYSYEVENNIIHIENFVYKTLLIGENQIIAKQEIGNGEFKNLVFDEIKS